MPRLYDDKRAKDAGARLRYNVILAEVKNQPCADCGLWYPPYVMDFDHRSGEVKLFTIGARKGMFGEAKLRAEIAKCDIVCANCHRVRTHAGP